MHSSLYILALTLFFAVEGLKCRLEQDMKSQEEFEDIVRSCLRQNSFAQHENNSNNRNNQGIRKEEKNHTNNRSHGRRQQSEDKQENSDSDYDYDNENQSNNKRDNNNWKSQKGRYNQNNNKQSKNYQNSYGNKNFNRHDQGNANNTKNIGSPLEGVEPCIIHCIFKQKKMLNQDNYLHKSSITRVLTERVRNSELREFIEDSVNECFDMLDNESNEGICDDTKLFALCLEEKGKKNCEDWDAGNQNNSNKNMNTDKVYYIGNDRNNNYNDRNNNRQTSSSSYNTKDKNSYSNGRDHTGGRQNSLNWNNRESERNKNYSIGKSNNGDNNQNEESNVRNKLTNYFQSRG